MTNFIVIHLLSNNIPNDKSDGDNVNVNIDSTTQRQQNLKSNGTQSSPSPVINLVDEGILAGQRIAKISVVTLIGIGIAELITGFLSGSRFFTKGDNRGQ